MKSKIDIDLGILSDEQALAVYGCKSFQELENKRKQGLVRYMRFGKRTIRYLRPLPPIVPSWPASQPSNNNHVPAEPVKSVSLANGMVDVKQCCFCNGPIGDLALLFSGKYICDLCVDGLSRLFGRWAYHQVRHGLDGSLRKQILDRDGNRCRYCGKRVNSYTRQIDHVIPVSSGGTHSLENLVVACRTCNASKADRSLQEANMRLLEVRF